MKPQRFTLTAVVTRYVFSEKVLIRYLPCTRYTVSNQHLAAEEPDISDFGFVKEPHAISCHVTVLFWLVVVLRNETTKDNFIQK